MDKDLLIKEMYELLTKTERYSKKDKIDYFTFNAKGCAQNRFAGMSPFEKEVTLLMDKHRDTLIDSLRKFSNRRNNMLLNFDKPDKIRSKEEHNRKHSSDSGVDGTYVPNMSDEDNMRWKCKHVTGKMERVEIRRLLGGVNLVIFVWKESYKGSISYPSYKIGMTKEERRLYDKQYEDYEEDQKLVRPDVKMSMNGTMQISFEDWKEIDQIVNEARCYLKGE